MHTHGGRAVNTNQMKKKSNLFLSENLKLIMHNKTLAAYLYKFTSTSKKKTCFWGLGWGSVIFHSGSLPLVIAILWQMSGFHSFVWLSNILCIYTTFHVSVHYLIGFLVYLVSYFVYCEHGSQVTLPFAAFISLVCMPSGGMITGPNGRSAFCFWKKSKSIFHNSCTCLIPVNSALDYLFLHRLNGICYF